MKAPYLHYCFFKEIVENIEKYKNNFEYDEDLLFNLSTFNNIGDYFSLSTFRDKYHFTENLNLKFNEFITECLITLEKKNDFHGLLFVYALVANHILDRTLTEYVNNLKNENYSVLEVYNMMDYFYAKKNDENLLKISLYQRFKKSFVYEEYMDNVIHYPCVSVLGLLASEAYFKKCYRKKKKFFKYFTRKNYRYPLHFMISAIKKSDYKIKDFVYNDHMDMSVIKQETENKVVLSLEDKINEASLEVNHAIKVMNEYLFDGNDSGVRKLFSISKEKKM